MLIHRILNNNAVVILNEAKQEQIVTGRGLAFKKKVGDIINEREITQIFKLTNKDTNKKFQELFEEIPVEYVEAADKVIQFSKTYLGKQLNDILYISLSDHIFGAVTRFNEGIQLRNPIMWDIKRFYEEEYSVGLEALKIIKQEFGIDLLEDEAAFIAIHIVNAELEHSNIDEIVEMTKLIQEVINLIKYYFKLELDTKSVYYYRFMSHIKFFAQRLIQNKQELTEANDSLYLAIKDSYTDTFKCVGIIGKYLSDKYHYQLTDDEKIYLTIHIERMVNKSRTN